MAKLSQRRQFETQDAAGDMPIGVQAGPTGDRSVEQIRVVRSSGHRLLDDAAVRIVRLSAPFAPFPPEIRKNVDVLDITRTWQFLDGGTLFSSN